MVLENRTLVIAWSEQQPSIGVWFEELGSSLDERVKVSTLSVLRSTLAQIRPPIVLALHSTEKVADVQDTGIPLDRFFQVEHFEPMVGMSIVVVSIAGKQEILVPTACAGIKLNQIATRCSLARFEFRHGYSPLISRASTAPWVDSEPFRFNPGLAPSSSLAGQPGPCC